MMDQIETAVLKAQVSKAKADIKKMTTDDSVISLDPRKHMLEAKKIQLEKVLNSYGKISLASVDISLVPVILSRLHGEESVIRRDIGMLSNREGSKRELQKFIDNAEEVLAKRKVSRRT